MRTFAIKRYAFVTCAVTGLLTACGGPEPQIAPIAQGGMPQNRMSASHGNRTNYEIVYSFRGVPDGYDPKASLLNVNGTLYGTTPGGGSSSCTFYYHTCGTVFSIAPDGAEKVLYKFKGGADGSNPMAGLIDVGGTLYGTTSTGGTTSTSGSDKCGLSSYWPCGTVFSVTLSGKERVLHRFRGGSDGAYPTASLIAVNGKLYGTTVAGGPYTSYYCPSGCGTVFSITPSGNERVLHSFGNGNDGIGPSASLVELKGTLYGTTCCGGVADQGTVFTITPSGSETVLHSFSGKSDNADGAAPFAPLIDVKGTLYGTTVFGGAYSVGGCSFEGCSGTVFSITSSGTETVLHSFGDGSDGGAPLAPLIDVKGTLYGTTAFGGKYHCCHGFNSARGTVFSITPSGTEKVLHSFGHGTDGISPATGLTDLGGRLYGTTENGGAYSVCDLGCGTVFALTP